MQARPEDLIQPCHVQYSIPYRVSYPFLQAHTQKERHKRVEAILIQIVSESLGHHTNQLFSDRHVQAEISQSLHLQITCDLERNSRLTSFVTCS